MKEIQADSHVSRQEFDIPPQKIEVTEHQAEIKTCPHCNHINCADFPTGLNRPAQYGPNLKAQLVYLGAYQYIAIGRIQDFVHDCYGYKISTGTLQNFFMEYYTKLAPFDIEVRQRLTESRVLHADESGMRVGDKNQWCHNYSTVTETLLLRHQKRGQEATAEHGLLPVFQNILIHDFWKPYFIYLCLHAVCNAHLLRELRFEWEVMKQRWARGMMLLLLRMKRHVDQKRAMSAGWQYRAIAAYNRLVALGMRHNPAPVRTHAGRGRIKKSSTRNLLERFFDFREEILRFAIKRDVPFDNNQAERDIRMAKLKQKVSGCFRSEAGADAFLRLRSFISTARKRGKPVLMALSLAYQGNPLMIFAE